MSEDNLQRVIESIDLSSDLTSDEILNLIDEQIRILSKSRSLSLKEREKIRIDAFHSIRELGVLQDLIEDSEITEIMVNGTDSIFIEKQG